MELVEQLNAGSIYVDTDDLPWVQARDGYDIEMRVLHARPEESISVVELRAPGGYVGGLHQHTGLVLCFTYAGAWGHDPEDFAFRPGVYAYEPPGVAHRFYASPEGAHAAFVSLHSTAEYVNDDGEVIHRNTCAGMVADYLARCEAAGHARPNVLG